MNFAMWLQSRLTAHGYAPGPIDGRIGPATIAAVRAFEAANGLPVDGTADEKVVKALRAPASAARPAEMVEIPDRDKDLGEGMLPTQRAWPRQSDVRAFFGEVGTDQVQVDIPFDMVLAWDKGRRVTKMTLHRKISSSAARALQTIAAAYSAQDRRALGLDLFGGSLNVRRMRGGNSWSTHSWGIAIDFDPERNQLSWHRPKARLSHPDAEPFWRAWEAEGWLSLGRARDFDWMHVQAARL